MLWFWLDFCEIGMPVKAVRLNFRNSCMTPFSLEAGERLILIFQTPRDGLCSDVDYIRFAREGNPWFEHGHQI